MGIFFSIMDYLHNNGFSDHMKKFVHEHDFTPQISRRMGLATKEQREIKEFFFSPDSRLLRT